MIFDATIHLGDIILAIVTLIIIPFVRSLSTGLFSLRDTVRDLNRTIGNSNPPTGLLGDVVNLKNEMREHRDWLISIRDRRE